MYSITWLDPRVDDADEPEWGVWDTECLTYRITWTTGNDEYVPSVRKQRLISSTCSSFVYEPIGSGYATLEEAQSAVNVYHCSTHHLELVS